MNQPHGHLLRKGRFSEEGRIYLVTTVTAQRQPFFAEFSKARAMVRILHAYSKPAQTLAYVLMPDHLHWLMQLGTERSLSRTVGAIKSVSAHTIPSLRWQTGFHDHAVRKEEDLRELARYIVLNPVRARLVNKVSDYPHWDAIWLGAS